jgi:hypothetical protein
MDVRFDVTDLDANERGALALEVAVQAEASDFVGDDGHGWTGHRGVEAPEIEYNEVEVDEPIYGWIGWEDGEELDPPEADKQWLTITEDGEEMAVIVHRHTGRDDGTQMAQKIRRAQRIVEALQATTNGEGNDDWCVGQASTGNMIRVGSQAEAMTALAGIELVDPEGVSKGMYFIDPPGNEDEGPGESSIYSNEVRP